MRVGIVLDDVLAKTSEHFEFWKNIHQYDANSYLDGKIVNDQGFWPSIPPYDDIDIVTSWALRHEIIVMCKRPDSLKYVTRAWLRKHNINCYNIVMNSLYRYDCRLHSIDVFVSTEDVFIPYYDTTRYIAVRVNNRGLNECNL
jgi:uncharacterized HAD superfamily protein